MIKKIPVGQLRVGMYVCDFNAGWLSHPFLVNRMMMRHEDDIAKVRQSGIIELFIDTSKGLDVDSGDSPVTPAAAPVTPRVVLSTADARPAATSLGEEMNRARSAYTQATRLIRSVMEDIRVGKQADLEPIRQSVETITGSVLRNSNAMLTLRRLLQREESIFEHSVNVCVMMTAFGKTLDLDTAQLHHLSLGALLHDIGKIKIAPEILAKAKAGTLSEEERKYLATHVMQGVEIVSQMPGVPRTALDVIEHHHECFDGSGFPHGLSGEGISLAGRMASIVNTYDTITSTKRYREKGNPADAVRQLYALCGKEFDPQLVQAFVRSIGIYPVGTLVRLASGRLAVVIEVSERSLLQPRVRVIYDSRHRHYLPPTEVDLARPEARGDTIVGAEAAATWGIDPVRFLAN